MRQLVFAYWVKCTKRSRTGTRVKAKIRVYPLEFVHPSSCKRATLSSTPLLRCICHENNSKGAFSPGLVPWRVKTATVISRSLAQKSLVLLIQGLQTHVLNQRVISNKKSTLGHFGCFLRLLSLKKNKTKLKYKKEKYIQKNCRRISRLLETINLSWS